MEVRPSSPALGTPDVDRCSRAQRNLVRLMDCRRAVENAALSVGPGAERAVGAKKRRYKGSTRASSIERVCGVSPQGGRRAELSLRGQLAVLGCCPFARFPARSGIAAISAEPSEDRLIGARYWWRFLYMVLRSCLPWPCPRASYSPSRKPPPARRMRTSKVQTGWKTVAQLYRPLKTCCDVPINSATSSSENPEFFGIGPTRRPRLRKLSPYLNDQEEQAAYSVDVPNIPRGGSRT